MKTKRELTEATGIPSSTFDYWMRLGFLPRACGVDKQRSLWPDDVQETIELIKQLQLAGHSLSEVREKLLERLMEQRRQAEAAKDSLTQLHGKRREWASPEKQREVALKALGLSEKQQTIDAFPGAIGNRVYIYIVALDVTDFIFAKVDVTTVGTATLLEKITVDMMIYAEMLYVFCQEYARQGHVFNTRGMAMVAFELPETFGRIRELAQKRHQTWKLMSQAAENLK